MPVVDIRETRRARLAELRRLLRERGADALLVSQPANLGYLSGFTGSTAWLLVSETAAFIVTDFRYYEQAGLECPEFELIKIRRNVTEVLAQAIERSGVRRLGFESDDATFAAVQDWAKAAPEVEWVPIQGLIVTMRAVKDAIETRLMRETIRLADDAFAAVIRQVQRGWTERRLAWAIDSYFHDHGASGPAFETIVAAAANGARPHAHATDQELPLGEPIVIDMGSRLNGYCSDLTRTICLGEPNDPQRFWEVYRLVAQAQQEAAAAIRPGLSGQEADAVARDLITAGGYGDCFGHSLGHGVGLAIHEEPGLRRGNAEPLVAGNFVTVEPGVYLPGWGGVRIEDLVLVTDAGVEVLSTASKEPIVAVQ